MSLKKYIGVIVVVLALLGFANQQKGDVHNQEIVLEFNESNVAKIDAQATVLIIKAQLQQLGINQFRVVENNEGKLKITYHSTTAVSSVKRVLLKNIRSQLLASDEDDAPLGFPLEDSAVAYHLDVHEIQNGNTTDSGLNGIEVLDIKPKIDRLFKPKTATATYYNTTKKEEVTFKVTFNIHKSRRHALQYALAQIPEVRAGPRCC